MIQPPWDADQLASEVWLLDSLTRPHSVKPIHYDISLFDLNFSGAWGYKGTVKVNLKVTAPTKEIVLNCKEIEVQAAEVVSKDGEE